MYCYQCGLELTEKMKFCPECGMAIHVSEKNKIDKSPISETARKPEEESIQTDSSGATKKCPNCFDVIPINAIRCRNCGADVGDKDSRLVIRDAWAPISTIVLIIAFFLPWISAGSRYYSRTLTALDLYKEADHPPTISLFAFLLALVLIIIYIAQLGGEKKGYLVRGIIAIILGLGWGGYSVIIYSSLSDSSDYSFGVGFMLTTIACFVLIFSGFATATVLYAKYKRAAFKEGLCLKCGLTNKRGVDFCRKCGNVLVISEKADAPQS